MKREQAMAAEETVDDDAATAARTGDGAGAQTLAAGVAESRANGWSVPRAVAYAAPPAVPEPQYALDDPDLPYWLAVSRVKGIGPARFKLLLEVFGAAEAAWTASPAEWQAAGLDARTSGAFEQ